MPKLIKIYWRDIPSQVIAKQGRKAAKKMLDQRFQDAIDSAAMRAGKGTSDAYMEDWTRHQEDVEGDIEELAATTVSALENEFPEDRLRQLTKAKGFLADMSD